MSVEAISWALNLAPVPMDPPDRRGKAKPNSSCAFVLVALANHASNDGTGAFPAVDTICRYTRLSERTVRTALDRLEGIGVIVPCDPDVIAAKIKRADRRPKGWDLDFNLMRDDLTDAQLDKIAEQNAPLRPWIELHKSRRGATAAPRDGVQPLHLVPRGATDDRYGVQPLQSRGAAVAPEPYLEPYLEPSMGQRDADASTPDDPTAPFEDDEPPPVVPAKNVDNDKPTRKRKPTNSNRGTRIPGNFEVTDEMREWAKTKGYGSLDLDAITEEFFDYWIAVPGQRGMKLDWTSTWRNWIRRDQQFHRGTSGGKPAAPHRKDSADYFWGQAGQQRSAR